MDEIIDCYHRDFFDPGPNPYIFTGSKQASEKISKDQEITTEALTLEIKNAIVIRKLGQK